MIKISWMLIVIDTLNIYNGSTPVGITDIKKKQKWIKFHDEEEKNLLGRNFFFATAF